MQLQAAGAGLPTSMAAAGGLPPGFLQAGGNPGAAAQALAAAGLPGLPPGMLGHLTGNPGMPPTSTASVMAAHMAAAGIRHPGLPGPVTSSAEMALRAALHESEAQKLALSKFNLSKL